jgi:hypothetical protein
MDKERGMRLAEIQEKELKNNNIIVNSLDHYLYEILPKRLENGTKRIEYGRSVLNQGKIKVDRVMKYLVTLMKVIIYLGALIGVFFSPLLLEKLSRKRAVLFQFIFSLLGSIISISAFFSYSPVCLTVGKLFLGIQGG